MDAIGGQIVTNMTHWLLGSKKQGFFQVLESGYYFWIDWGEMRSGFSTGAWVSVVREGDLIGVLC